ncbi:MAG TPA: hypothetical protein VMA34_21965 [Terracidiphilus sp.]|nr:hypothetical protein [Terracidiphilus sp.]
MRALRTVKALHSAIWVFFVSCILGVPLAAVAGRFRLAVILSGLVWIECGVLAVNRGRCPLTDVAARWTPDRDPGFDIYLPKWLARSNLIVFGSLFGIGEVILAVAWVRR